MFILHFSQLGLLVSALESSRERLPIYVGGLNYQIEHHLFPSMPRHNFHKIQAKVQEICEKHNVKYHVTDFMSGTKEIMQRLQHVSEYAIKAKKL
jgi:fatty acid desaturase